MSNVLARKRRLSELEFYKTGTEIRAEFTRYLMNDKKVPKRWKPIFTFTGVGYVTKLMEEIVAANTIYPTTESEVADRRRHQTNAITQCEQLRQHIAWMIETLELSAKDFENLGGMILLEIKLLKAWRKANKIMVSKEQ